MTRRAPERRRETTTYVERIVDSAPPLSIETADQIAALLRPANRKQGTCGR